MLGVTKWQIVNNLFANTDDFLNNFIIFFKNVMLQWWYYKIVIFQCFF